MSEKWIFFGFQTVINQELNFCSEKLIVLIKACIQCKNWIYHFMFEESLKFKKEFVKIQNMKNYENF